MTQTWQSIKLSKVLTKSNEWIDIDLSQSYKQVTVKMWGKGVELRSEVLGTEISASKRLQVHPEQFILSRIDARHGAFGLIPNSLNLAVVTNDFPVFNLNRELLLPDFLNWLSKTADFVDICRLASEGTTNRVRLKEDKFLSTEIRLPPIAEQRQIVARIEELAAKIEEARGLRESAIKELSAIVSAEKNSLFCNDFFAKYPNKKLGEIADIRAGVTLGRKLEGKTITLPYLRVANVQDGYLDLDSLKEVEIYELELEKWLLKYGDLLLTEGGDWDKLGRGTVWRSEIPGCIHQNHIFRLRVDLAEFMPEFLSTLISSPHGKEYFQGASKQTTNLATINQRQLKAFQIAQPPMEEQERIVNFINDVQTKVEEMKRLREDALKEFDALLPAILDKAFKGEL